MSCLDSLVFHRTHKRALVGHDRLILIILFLPLSPHAPVLSSAIGKNPSDANEVGGINFDRLLNTLFLADMGIGK